MAGHHEAEHALRRNPCAIAGEVRGLRAVVARESLKQREARNEVGIDNAGSGQCIWIRVRASGQRVRGEKTAGTTRSTATKGDRQEGRLKAQLVDTAYVLTHVVDAVAAAQRSGVAPEEIPGEADARREAGCVVVVIRGVAASGIESGDVERLRAAAKDEGILPLIGEGRIKISDVAEIVVECAEDFGAETVVQSEVGAEFPLVLAIEGEVVGAILMVVDATAAEAERRGAFEELLKVGRAAGRG